MKISKEYLQKIINEEINKILTEADNEQEFLSIFVDMYNALNKREKTLGKKFKLVDNSPSFYEILSKAKRDKGVDSNDLLDILQNMSDKIDKQMYQSLRDAFTNDIYEIDAEYLDKSEDQDQFDSKMSDMYQKTTGKPDLRIVK